ncbi:MAG: bifunctional folylpolyglutamate synthase/dihydrofolate synthase [Dehalococcoidia bacterium]|nr:bifunctional folylpolyglutamate synthase/dihydrofolate synthase [Dehalococcoidia bacterium]
MDYQEALAKLLSLTDMERMIGQTHHASRYDLGRVRLLLERLDNPHLRTPTVHITGTKGKGSTAATIASVLNAQGYNAGLFTSPHLHTFRERIQLGGQPVSEEEFASLVDAIWPEVESMNSQGALGEVTTFEMLTAMAFLHFARQRVGFQVIEVGLGGRLDSTNLVQPRVCVITSISLDHTQILGDTVEQIARDKSGIIKPGSVAVTSPQTPGVMAVLKDACRAQSVDLVSVEQGYTWAMQAHDLGGQSFTVAAPWGEVRLWTPLLGEHQLENAATSVAALHVLDGLGFPISDKAMSQGFRSVWWPARLEVLSRKPLVVADGAHNPYSAGKLREALRQYFSFERLIYVVGLSADKNAHGIIQELAPGAHLVVATRSRHPRAVPPDLLADGFCTAGVEAVPVDGVKAALDYALSRTKASDLVVATGSLFVAAEAREAILGVPPELYPSLQPQVQGP